MRLIDNPVYRDLMDRDAQLEDIIEAISHASSRQEAEDFADSIGYYSEREREEIDNAINYYFG